MTQDGPERNLPREAEKLKRMAEEFGKMVPFPKLGYRVDHLPETDDVLDSFASRTFGWSDVLHPEHPTIITKELEEAVRRVVSSCEIQADADYLMTYFERMKELEAQLFKCALLEREGLSRGDNTAK